MRKTSNITRTAKAFSLVELLVVVIFLSAMAAIAVPRINFKGIHRRKAETQAFKIITDLRRTRTLAISNAASNPDGYQLKFNLKKNDPYSYDIIELHTDQVIDSHEIDTDVTVKCKGNGEYTFGTLGNIVKNAGKEITVTAQSKEFTITPETGGAIKWSETQ